MDIKHSKYPFCIKEESDNICRVIIKDEDDNWIANCVVNLKNKDISELYVETVYRKKGFATILLKSVIDAYRVRFLKVYRDNIEAINLYTKIGFVKYAVDSDFMYMEYINLEGDK